MNIVWIDCETTGLDPTRNTIIDIWACETDDLGDPTGSDGGGRVLLADADLFAASPRALEVNGYSDDAWAATARSWPEVWGDVEELVLGAYIIGGHNPLFDLVFLSHRLGRPLLPRTIDTCSLARPLVWSGRSKSARLDDLCAALGIEGAAHAARGDVERTIALYRRLRDGLGWRG